MRSLGELTRRVRSGDAQTAFFDQTTPSDPDIETARMVSVLSSFASEFGEDRNAFMLSAPGRTELAGNHTDHNRGRVLAGSCSLDIIGVVSPRTDRTVRIRSAGFEGLIVVDGKELSSRPDEQGTPAALVRGVSAFFSDQGFKIGGFDAVMESRVLPGSGLSSSAAFEVFTGSALNTLFNDSTLKALDIAQAGQYAENHFFGKPCGLMDQIACAHGGVVAIDFGERVPDITGVNIDFAEAGYTLFVIDTGGNHADLTSEYAAVPEEMRLVAKALGHEVLGEGSHDAFFEALPELRATCSDRALLRAMHFYQDNERVEDMVVALREGRVDDYLKLVNESGISSSMLLQNYFSTGNPGVQGISLACATATEYLNHHDLPGAVRVHGGGFAGTIQAYVPNAHAEPFRAIMEQVFGEGSVIALRIRSVGPVAFS
ncbi:MAG: galactokinase [Spirochaetaceae bacterium]